MFTMVFPPEAPCGCESGKTFGDCHLKDGKVEIAYKDINPPQPPTYRSNKKCYFAFTNNCDNKISREHVISRAVLKEITDKKITITGEGFTRNVSIDSSTLTTKRLCKRHNSAINLIDREAGRIIRAVKRADATLGKEIKTLQLVCFFHGFDIERWLLKTLLNVYHSGLSASRITNVLPNDIVRMFSDSMKSPYGLYIPVKKDDGDLYALTVSNQASFHLMMEGNVVVGISVSLAGLELKLIVAGTQPYNTEFQGKHVFRPKTINFFQGQDAVSIMIVWIDGSPYDIWISRGDKNASAPKGIGGIISDHLVAD